MIEVLAIQNGDNGGFFPDEHLSDPADIMVICSILISCDVIYDDADDLSDDNSSDEDGGVNSLEAGFTTQV